MLSSSLKLADSYKSFRKLPLNYRKEDADIFDHQMFYEGLPGYLLILKNIYYTGYGVVETHGKESLPKEFVFYNSTKVRSILKFLYFILKKILKNRYSIIQEPVVFIVDIRSNNYFHWVAEVIPRLLEAKEKIEKYPIILPAKFRDLSFVSDSLNYIGLKFTYLEKFSLYKLKHLFFVSHFSITGNYHDEIIQKTRKVLRSTDKPASSNQRVYISRARAERRKIANEEELEAILKSHDFKIIYCEQLSFCEQATIFSGAKILISIHGAGLTNMMFMENDNKVLEIRYKNDFHNNCYFSLASALNLRYYYFLAEPVCEGEDPYSANVTVDIPGIKWVIDSMVNDGS